MKAILEFNLPEEQVEYYDAQNGFYFALILTTILNELRAVYKYESKEVFKNVSEEAAEEVRARIYKLIQDYNVEVT